MSDTGWRAWYVAQNPDGSWDFTVSTKTVVMLWESVPATGGHGVEVHGFVVDPSSFGESGALVPADTVVIGGYDGRPQRFAAYLPDDDPDDNHCGAVTSALSP